MSGPAGPIILVGPMGAGKSEVGKALARRLGRTFVDTDQIVERRAEKSIADIFETESESGFRKREEGAITESVRIPNAVIACGGGAVKSRANVDLMRRAGMVLYLRVGVSDAAARLDGDASRPLLGEGGLEERLAELIFERAPLYKGAAHHVIDADGPVEEVVERVLEVVLHNEVRGTSRGRRGPSPR